MEKDKMLERKTQKEWFICVLLGFFIGLAVIIPGISGATIAIIFGLHGKLLYAFDNILSSFKKCFIWLLPIAIGVMIGFGFGFIIVQKLFDVYPFIIICLFAGLMIGSFPAVKDEIKNVKMDKQKIILFVLGTIIPIAIGIASVFISDNSPLPIEASVWLTACYFMMGFFVSVTQLVPGLSCSVLLMIFGQYGSILATVKLDYLKANPSALFTLGGLALGFIIGIIVFSKVINVQLEKRRDATYSAIVGLALGSIVSMFINPEVWAVYKTWHSFKTVALELAIGVFLMTIGIVATYALVRYQRHKNKEKVKKLEEKSRQEQKDSIE